MNEKKKTYRLVLLIIHLCNTIKTLLACGEIPLANSWQRLGHKRKIGRTGCTLQGADISEYDQTVEIQDLQGEDVAQGHPCSFLRSAWSLSWPDKTICIETRGFETRGDKTRGGKTNRIKSRRIESKQDQTRPDEKRQNEKRRDEMKRDETSQDERRRVKTRGDESRGDTRREDKMRGQRQGNCASRTAGATTATIARQGQCGCAVCALVTVARCVRCLFNARDARLCQRAKLHCFFVALPLPLLHLPLATPRRSNLQVGAANGWTGAPVA
jgi:hypothetical protein